MKIYKPDTRVYELPIKKYKIQSDEITFLSANTWDVSGGGNFGYNSIWVNRNNSVFDILDFQPKNEFCLIFFVSVFTVSHSSSTSAPWST